MWNHFALLIWLRTTSHSPAELNLTVPQRLTPAGRLAYHQAHSGEVMKEQQAELVKQGQVMSRVLDATGQIVNLEKSLNENLATLAGSKNFEDTVMSLSAAIHLLNTQLGGGPGPAPQIDISQEPPRSEGRAA